MSIRIKSGEWKVAYAVSGAIDLIQILIGFTGYGIIVNEVADVIIGVLLVIYFLIRGFSPAKHTKLFISLLGIAALEELTGGFAPAWILDIYYANKIAKAEKAEMEAGKEADMMFQNDIRQPLYSEGFRKPRPENEDTSEIGRPANFNGVRAPRGGLKMALK